MADCSVSIVNIKANSASYPTKKIARRLQQLQMQRQQHDYMKTKLNYQ